MTSGPASKNEGLAEPCIQIKRKLTFTQMKHHPQIIHSISELHRLNSFPKPEHPLVSLVRFEDMRDISNEFPGGFIFDFYLIAIKRGLKTKIKYGQHYYDFDEGVMSFIAPGQVIGNDHQDTSELS